MTEKIVGYSLLVLGLLIIIFSGVSVYQVYTKQTQPVNLFAFSGISVDMSQLLAQSLPQELKNSGVAIPPLSQEIISAPMVNVPMNLFAHTVLMGFLGSVGLKLAQVGTWLIRTIQVNVKEEKPITKEQITKPQ